jgi:hypothetical protein
MIVTASNGLVPGGALQADGHWRGARSTYLFPVRVLARQLRGKRVAALRQAWHEGKLSRIVDPKQVDAMLDTLMRQDWVAYSKPAIARTETLIGYLARYTHRIALSDSRILAIDANNAVSLRYKGYRDHDRLKVLHLEGEELIHRYLLHVLPPGFMRIRHYGLLANRCRAKRLAQVRTALAAATPKPAQSPRLAPAHSAGRDGYARTTRSPPNATTEDNEDDTPRPAPRNPLPRRTGPARSAGGLVRNPANPIAMAISRPAPNLCRPRCPANTPERSLPPSRCATRIASCCGSSGDLGS